MILHFAVSFALHLPLASPSLGVCFFSFLPQTSSPQKTSSRPKHWTVSPSSAQWRDPCILPLPVPLHLPLPLPLRSSGDSAPRLKPAAKLPPLCRRPERKAKPKRHLYRFCRCLFFIHSPKNNFDRSTGQSHRPARSGEIPVFSLCLAIPPAFARRIEIHHCHKLAKAHKVFLLQN